MAVGGDGVEAVGDSGRGVGEILGKLFGLGVEVVEAGDGGEPELVVGGLVEAEGSEGEVVVLGIGEAFGFVGEGVEVEEVRGLDPEGAIGGGVDTEEACGTAAGGEGKAREVIGLGVVAVEGAVGGAEPKVAIGVKSKGIDAFAIDGTGVITVREVLGKGLG